MAVDINDERLELARQYGADRTYNSTRHPELAKELLDLTRGQGFMACFDFVGTDETLALCISLCASEGKVPQNRAGRWNRAHQTAGKQPIPRCFSEFHPCGAIFRSLRVQVVAFSRERSAHPHSDGVFYPLEQINEVAQKLKAGANQRARGDSAVGSTPSGIPLPYRRHRGADSSVLKTQLCSTRARAWPR